MLAYYSNNTFNYSKIGVIIHDEYEYNVVDYVFFENGTEMSAPTDENMTSISGIIEKGIKYKG